MGPLGDPPATAKSKQIAVVCFWLVLACFGLVSGLFWAQSSHIAAPNPFLTHRVRRRCLGRVRSGAQQERWCPRADPLAALPHLQAGGPFAVGCGPGSSADCLQESAPFRQIPCSPSGASPVPVHATTLRQPRLSQPRIRVGCYRRVTGRRLACLRNHVGGRPSCWRCTRGDGCAGRRLAPVAS